MGVIRFPKPVCLVCAICFKDQVLLPKVLERICEQFGESSSVSELLMFHHTEYYQEEMGSPLYKIYVSFKNTIDPVLLPDVKHFTNDIEASWADNNSRRVNLDPGYIEPAKLVLASTKNYSHRIYLAKGIYGDVQLVWRHNRFQFNPWTYPDYKEDKVVAFFTTVRNVYFLNLKKEEKREREL